MHKIVHLAALFSIAVASHAECVDNVLGGNTNGHFELNASGQILDSRTGLVWQQCVAGQHWVDGRCSWQEGEVKLTWREAIAAQPEGWRLPNKKELETLVVRNCYRPALDHQAFGEVEVGLLWTSTPTLNGASRAWAIDFNDGAHLSVSNSNRYAVRWVKSAP